MGARDTDRLVRLERSVRWIILAVGALVLLQAWSVLRPGAAAQGPSLLAPARAESGILRVTNGAYPALLFTTTQSGATLYMWEWDAKKHAYRRSFFGS